MGPNFEQGFAIMQTFVILFIVLVVGATVFAVFRQARTSKQDAAAPEVSAVARVADKRVETSGGGELSVTQRHFVTFEQPSGERFELLVPASEFGLLVVGDHGTVAMKGTRFLGFQRELLR